MRICLDTNAYSAFKRGDADVIDLVIWIAAIAMERGAQLVTMDSHFDDIPGVFATGWEP